MAELGVPAVPVLTDHDAPVMARDGTRLRADVYRAAEGGPFPVLLIRNPYGEQLVRAASPVIPAIDAGFAVVVQHCRGTGTSDGEFVTFENEAADGAPRHRVVRQAAVVRRERRDARPVLPRHGAAGRGDRGAPAGGAQGHGAATGPV